MTVICRQQPAIIFNNCDEADWQPRSQGLSSPYLTVSEGWVGIRRQKTLGMRLDNWHLKGLK